MATSKHFKVSYPEGSPDDYVLPIDGVFYTDVFAPDRESNLLVVAMYDANGDIVEATAGTCSVEVSPIKGQWFNAPSTGDATVDLTLAGSTASYILPTFYGPVIQARITFNDVAGAETAKAYMWRV